MDDNRINWKQQKEIVLSMMDDIHKFCIEHDIQYFLAYGTLLGAIRHGGYIPWDDDFDIMMSREDYSRFVKSYNNKTSFYKVLDYSLNAFYYYPFAKVVDTRTVLYENSVSSAMPLGLYIDVFPIDLCGDDKAFASKSINRQLFLWRNLNTIKLMSLNKPRSAVKSKLVYFLKNITKCISWTYILRRISNVACNFCKQPDAIYVGIVNTGISEKCIFKKEALKCKKLCKFENYEFFVPQNYDEILSAWYGDYMKLPPESERVAPHDYVVYWK